MGKETDKGYYWIWLMLVIQSFWVGYGISWITTQYLM